MSTLHFHQVTSSTPEQFIAGLTDFGPGRSKLLPNSADASLLVHHLGARETDVTEGGRGTWERLHYYWSEFGGASGYTYTLTPRPDGTTEVDVVIVREGKNLRGRVLAGVLGTVDEDVLGKAFTSSVDAIEARNDTQAARS